MVAALGAKVGPNINVRAASSEGPRSDQQGHDLWVNTPSER
jgi:hypothetical protein